MSSTPLDLPGQITMLAWTLQEYPDAAKILVLLRDALALAGVEDIQALKARKVKGLSVFEQGTIYPSGSAKDAANLVQQLQIELNRMVTPTAPAGAPVVAGPSWVMPAPAPASAATLTETRYTPPLT